MGGNQANQVKRELRSPPIGAYAEFFATLRKFKWVGIFQTALPEHDLVLQTLNQLLTLTITFGNIVLSCLLQFEQGAEQRVEPRDSVFVKKRCQL